MTISIVAQQKEYVLFDTGKPFGDWIGLKLSKISGKGKRNWWFGWHTVDHRLSRTADVESLVRDYPDVLEWVLRELKNTKRGTLSNTG